MVHRLKLLTQTLQAQVAGLATCERWLSDELKKTVPNLGSTGKGVTRRR